MILKLQRLWKKESYTIGRLWVDGVLLCNTLEDKDRGLSQSQDISYIQSVKVPGETAIPAGKYAVAMDIVSPKYSANAWYMRICGGRVPRLLNVPGFDGILIHVGNTAIDTQGCILVGQNTFKGRLTSSKDTFVRLYGLLNAAYERGERIIIEIE